MNSELRPKINHRDLPWDINQQTDSILGIVTVLGTQRESETYSQTCCNSLLSGEGRWGNECQTIASEQSPSGKCHEIATENWGLKYLIKFSNEVKRNN